MRLPSHRYWPTSQNQSRSALSTTTRTRLSRSCRIWPKTVFSNSNCLRLCKTQAIILTIPLQRSIQHLQNIVHPKRVATQALSLLHSSSHTCKGSRSCSKTIWFPKIVQIAVGVAGPSSIKFTEALKDPHSPRTWAMLPRTTLLLKIPHLSFVRQRQDQIEITKMPLSLIR